MRTCGVKAPAAAAVLLNPTRRTGWRWARRLWWWTAHPRNAQVRRAIAELPDAHEEAPAEQRLEPHAEELHADDVPQAIPEPRVHHLGQGEVHARGGTDVGAPRAPLERLSVGLLRHELLQAHTLDAAALERHHGAEARGVVEDRQVFVERHDDVADHVQQRPQRGALALQHGGLHLAPSLGSGVRSGEVAQRDGRREVPELVGDDEGQELALDDV
mmetsp:Transcript_8440/g.24167  ORF Transcript_8440/g.24167 Transcript_8440/m.24167 type:complete len:216 (+) Transcript_8440:311-958(+)